VNTDDQNTGSYPGMDTENFKVNKLMDDIGKNHYESKFRTYLPKEISLVTLASKF
jgi:hypothetical protein